MRIVHSVSGPTGPKTAGELAQERHFDLPAIKIAPPPVIKLITPKKPEGKTPVYFPRSWYVATPPKLILSPRLQQVAACILDGLTVKETAYVLGLSTGTAKIYSAKLFHLTGTINRLDFAVVYYKNMISPADRHRRRSLYAGETGTQKKCADCRSR